MFPILNVEKIFFLLFFNYPLRFSRYLIKSADFSLPVYSFSSEHKPFLQHPSASLLSGVLASGSCFLSVLAWKGPSSNCRITGWRDSSAPVWHPNVVLTSGPWLCLIMIFHPTVATLQLLACFSSSNLAVQGKAWSHRLQPCCYC